MIWIAPNLRSNHHVSGRWRESDRLRAVRPRATSDAAWLLRPRGGEPGRDLPAGAGALRRDAVRDAGPGARAFGAADALSAAGAGLPGSAGGRRGAALALALVAAPAGVHRLGAGDSGNHVGAGRRATA